MCGAASVLGTMRAVAEMKLQVNLTIVVPAVENMPAHNASKPGDVVKSMSGFNNSSYSSSSGNCHAVSIARSPAAIKSSAKLWSFAITPKTFELNIDSSFDVIK
jgi:hypothetical protein